MTLHACLCSMMHFLQASGNRTAGTPNVLVSGTGLASQRPEYALGLRYCCSACFHSPDGSVVRLVLNQK